MKISPKPQAPSLKALDTPIASYVGAVRRRMPSPTRPCPHPVAAATHIASYVGYPANQLNGVSNAEGLKRSAPVLAGDRGGFGVMGSGL